MMNADHFIGAAVGSDALEPNAPEVRLGPRFSCVVVDEGHVVFSRQPDAGIHGQRRFRDAWEARGALEKTLADGGDAPVVVFHDESYQRVGKSTGDQIPHPERRAHPKAPLPIARNPGSARGLSIPLCKELKTSDLQKANGRQSYHPLLEENPGEAALLVDAPRADARPTVSNSFELAEKLAGESSWMCDRESEQQPQKHAEQIVAQLSRIKDGFEGWAEHVAALAPGLPPTVAQQLLDAARESAQG